MSLAAERRLDCERIAQEAGRLVRSRFGDPGEVRGKGELDDEERRFDVVTEVDHLSERLILERIAAVNPDARVLAEEGGVTDSGGARIDVELAQVDELWLVDPLDGTVNFAHGVPHFCVSVACWRRGEPLAGAIVDPMVGETFSFERDADGAATAFHDGAPLARAGATDTHAELLYVGGAGNAALRPVMRRFRSWRRLGSAALALAWTGSGRCGAYVQPGQLHPWDWAVGVPFIQAAGGIVTDAHGRTWAGRLDGTTGVIAAASAIHPQIVAEASDAALAD